MLTTFRSQIYSNTDMFNPLVERMVNKDPSERPSSSEALREWKATRRPMSRFQRYWRLRPREEMWIATFWYECKAGVSICALSHLFWTSSLTPHLVDSRGHQILAILMGLNATDRLAHTTPFLDCSYLLSVQCCLLGLYSALARYHCCFYPYFMM